jgi:hypothetical protein
MAAAGSEASPADLPISDKAGDVVAWLKSLTASQDFFTEITSKYDVAQESPEKQGVTKKFFPTPFIAISESDTELVKDCKELMNDTTLVLFQCIVMVYKIPWTSNENVLKVLDPTPEIRKIDDKLRQRREYIRYLSKLPVQGEEIVFYFRKLYSLFRLLERTTSSDPSSPQKTPVQKINVDFFNNLRRSFTSVLSQTTTQSRQRRAVPEGGGAASTPSVFPATRRSQRIAARKAKNVEVVQPEQPGAASSDRSGDVVQTTAAQNTTDTATNDESGQPEQPAEFGPAHYCCHWRDEHGHMGAPAIVCPIEHFTTRLGQCDAGDQASCAAPPQRRENSGHGDSRCFSFARTLECDQRADCC